VELKCSQNPRHTCTTCPIGVSFNKPHFTMSVPEGSLPSYQTLSALRKRLMHFPFGTGLKIPRYFRIKELNPRRRVHVEISKPTRVELVKTLYHQQISKFDRYSIENGILSEIIVIQRGPLTCLHKRISEDIEFNFTIILDSFSRI
jgi:hypothetical protein